MEKWLPITGYEGFYEVSSFGNIRRVAYFDNASLSHHELYKNMKQRNDKLGYKTIKLSKNGTQKYCKVHRLVATAFIENPSLLPQVNHIDGDKQNNSVSNLEWCSQTHNMKHAFEIGLRENIKNGKTSKPIGKYALTGKLICVYANARDVERQHSFRNSNIRLCCIGKLRKAYGFIWRYVDIEKPIEQLENVELILHSQKDAKPVVQKTLSGDVVKYYPSMKYARKFGFCDSAIAKCCNGEYKQHKGFLWEYA